LKTLGGLPEFQAQAGRGFKLCADFILVFIRNQLISVIILLRLF
jgi:hypothetical protein